jgi:hypothetical protein
MLSGWFRLCGQSVSSRSSAVEREIDSNDSPAATIGLPPRSGFGRASPLLTPQVLPAPIEEWVAGQFETDPLPRMQAPSRRQLGGNFEDCREAWRA